MAYHTMVRKRLMAYHAMVSKELDGILHTMVSKELNGIPHTMVIKVNSTSNMTIKEVNATSNTDH